MNIIYSIVLACGMWNGGLMQYEPYQHLFIEKPIYTSVQTDIQWGPVFLIGGIRTDMFILEWNSTTPFQNTWNTGAGLRFGPAEIGWKHTCFHPMAAYQWQGYQVTPKWEGGIDEIYASLKLEGKF